MTEVDLIEAVLKSPAGVGVNLFDSLQAYRLEDGSFVVSFEDAEESGDKFALWWEDSLVDHDFATAREAAECFVRKRHEMKLGYDHEAPAGK